MFQKGHQVKLVWPKRVEQAKALSEEVKRILAWSICWEGSIVLGRQKHVSGGVMYRPRLEIANTDLGLLEAFQLVIGFGRIDAKKSSSEKWKPAWLWRVEGIRQVEAVLREILPYLPSKVERAKLVLEFCERRKSGIHRPRGNRYQERDFQIIEELHRLHREGGKGRTFMEVRS